MSEDLGAESEDESDSSDDSIYATSVSHKTQLMRILTANYLGMTADMASVSSVHSLCVRFIALLLLSFSFCCGLDACYCVLYNY